MTQREVGLYIICAIIGYWVLGEGLCGRVLHIPDRVEKWLLKGKERP